MRLRAEKTAVCALFCAFAMILSYIESVIPTGGLIPLPGVKLGLANIAVTVVFLIYGTLPAVSVSIARITLTSLLFGNATSFLYSICGGALSFAALIAWKYVFSKFNGYIGLSVLSAAMHNVGQCISACLFFGPNVIFAYLPILLLLSLVTGTFSGAIISLVMKSAENVLGI